MARAPAIFGTGDVREPLACYFGKDVVVALLVDQWTLA